MFFRFSRVRYFLGKALEKQTKAIKDQGRKQIDAIINKKKGKWVLDSKILFHKEIFEELVKERFDEIIELADETNFDDLIYHFKGNTARKRFNDFENEIKLSEI